MAEFTPLSWDALKPSASNTETRASRGVFAEHPVATPKYVVGDGERTVSTQAARMARLYIAVTETERRAFSEAVTRMGVPAELIQQVTSKFGYVDFVLQRVGMPQQEKHDVIETVTDDFVSYFYGSAAPTWTFSGVVLNSKEDDQAVNLFRLYRGILRGSELARRRKRATIAFDSYIVTGTFTGLQQDLSAENEMVVPFTLPMLVDQIDLRDNPKWGIYRAETGDYFGNKLAQEIATGPTSSSRLVMVPPVGGAKTPSTSNDVANAQPAAGEYDFTLLEEAAKKKAEERQQRQDMDRAATNPRDA